MSAAESRTKPTYAPVNVAAQALALVLALVLLAIGEWFRWSDEEARDVALTAWLCGRTADWLPYAPWLLLAPVLWKVRRTVPGGMTPPTNCGPVAPTLATWLSALGIAGLSLLVSILAARRFGGMPPAYHDEFSYLFQAETFLAGRAWFPSFEPMPELFNQMHVLNEGRFASRYFPGTGAWLTLFVWLGNAWAGEWVAAAIAAFCTFWIGREVGGEFVGRVAGVLAALSPGLALFSNLLLAHHPTLAGLTFFVWMYLRARRTGSAWSVGLAGAGLAFAMLCRPMTAFGVGLPFGLHFGWWLLRGGRGFFVNDDAGSEQSEWKRRWLLAGVMIAPLLAGLGVLGAYNRSITGDALVSPYQLYTDIYTPRHVYGFNNVLRGEQRLGPKVLDHYDRWAENLTPELAARNVGRRIAASLRWTLGIVPLLLAGLAIALSRGGRNTGCRLVAAAIISLHVVHVPYWFEGIMGWHYVFESAPFWLVLFGEGTRRLWISWAVEGRRAMRWWWVGMTTTAVLVNLVSMPTLWPGRLEQGISEVAFARSRHARFRQEVEQVTRGQRAIVFVVADESDRHIDFVVNSPALDDRVLIARHPGNAEELARARGLFPDRVAFVFDAAGGEWRVVE